MLNLYLSMSFLLIFNFYKLYILTESAGFLTTNLSILFYIFFINSISVLLYIFLLDSLFFQKIPPIIHSAFFKKISPKIKPQLMLLFFSIYILLINDKIPPGGNFHTEEVTIFNNTALCDYYAIPNCIKTNNNITIPGNITIKYLLNNQKLLIFNYINYRTNKKTIVSITLNSPEIGWTTENCYTSRYFMNAISPFFK